MSTSPQHRGGVLEIRDSAGFEWEEISVPSVSGEHENLIPPPSTEPPKQLCGYLNKLGAKGPIKTWKNRWFVFDDQRCCLYYYNTRNDFTPQGVIDISSATLTYSVDNLSKCQFEICTPGPGRIYYLQASSQDAMLYWLEALQKKRRKFSAKRKKAMSSNSSIQTPGGLVGDSNNLLLSAEQDDLPQEAPASLRSPPIEGESKGRLSIRQRMTSLSNKFRSPPIHSQNHPLSLSPNALRKSNFYVEPPIHEESAYDQPNGGLPECSSSQELLGDSHTQKVPGPGRNKRSFAAATENLFRKVTHRTSLYATPEGCPRCQELQETIGRLEHDFAVKDREVKDRDEINEFLRNEIRMADMKAKVRMADMKAKVRDELGSVPVDKKVDVLVQREQTIAEFQRLLEEAIGEKDRVKTELDAKRCEVETLGEQVALFKEAIDAKDHVVVDLTNKLFQLENKGQVPTNPQDAMLPTTSQALQEELDKMKESVEAYKHQNQFLSGEILELNTLRQEDLETYRMLINKYHEMEAKYYQIKSKYMILLQEAQAPRIGAEMGPNQQELLSRMLEEALQGEDTKKQGDKADSYDQYGFSQGATADQEWENPLKQRVRKLDQQAQSFDEVAASQKIRWDNFLASCGGGREIQRSTELKSLIRGGIPPGHRSTVWKWCIKDTLGRNYIPGQYQAILTQHAGQSSVAVNQIELDLLRTLPTNKYYDKADAQGINKLRRVLVGFSWYDPVVGYCQGLNRLAAIALLFLDEEDAFWCLVAIVRFLLPNDYYDKTLLGSQTDQRVLRDLLLEKAPRLSAHLTACDIDFSLITFNWFHTIYVDNLPVETMLRIWDTFLYEGSKVLFRFAIAIFKYNEEALLSMDNSITIFNRLRNMCQDATDAHRLVQIGFNEINPFPMQKIHSKRLFHRQQIKAELEEIESIRLLVQTVPIPIPQVSKDIDSDEETLISLN